MPPRPDSSHATASPAPQRDPFARRGFPRRPGLVALVAVALFLLVALDTILRGPLTSRLDAANLVVTRWQQDGFPAHLIGRWLSHVGEFAICGALPFLVAATAHVLGRRALAIAAAASGLAGMLAEWTTQRLLSPLNRPVPSLDPYLVPDTASPLRVAGEHLFPSGHVLVATLGWGWLFLAGLPLLATWRNAEHDATAARRWGVALWLVACLAVAAGRLLRQAHAYNDVVAGWALGSAVLFAGFWLQDRIAASLHRQVRP